MFAKCRFNLVLCFLLFSVHTSAQAWTQLPQTQTARSESAAIDYQGNMYVFNGFGPNIKIATAIEKYDGATQTWSIVGSTSVAKGTAVTHNGIVRVGSKVWLIGGRIGNHPGPVTKNVWIYDLNTGGWQKGPQLPIPGAGGGAALVANKIHWFGGLDPFAVCDVNRHYTLDLNNTAAGWQNITAVAGMPNPRNHFSTVVVNNIIYAIGGQFGHDRCPNQPAVETKLVHSFNPLTNTWARVADLPLPQSHNEPSTFEHNGYIYSIGGERNGKTVMRYNPSADKWANVMSLPTNLLAPVARIFNGKLIVAGGGAPNTQSPVRKVYSKAISTPAGNTTSGTGGNTGNSGNTSTGNAIYSIEAEDFDSRTGTPSHQWVNASYIAASNNASMVTTPNSGTIKRSASGSPVMSYKVNFAKAGTHYVWIRGWGDTNKKGEGKNDSLHVGLNGVLQNTADNIDGFPANGWHWTRDTRDGPNAKINVPSAGIHTLNIWMREDGLAVDKILVAEDPNFVPQGTGPITTQGGTGGTTVVNSAPVVNAGTNTSITLGGSILLKGQASDDNLPSNSLTTVWTKASGPGSITFTDADKLQTNVSFSAAGTYKLKLTASDGLLSSNDSVTVIVNQAVITGGGTGGGSGSGNELISVEAEAFDVRTGTATHQWINSSLAGASGAKSMVTTPNSGTIKGSAAGSPMMSYFVYFNKPGTHYVWIRGWGDTNNNGEGKNDSIHVGLNGKLSTTADKIDKFPAGGWHWSRSTRDGVNAKLNVPSAGLHAVNIWMREDGLAVDKFVITDDPQYIPQATGPAVNLGTAGGGTGGGNTGGGNTGGGNTVNAAPLVNAGINAAITLGNTVALSGQVSDDGLPSNTLTSNWKKSTGPGVVSFTSTTSPQTLASFTVAGIYTLTLTATDGSLSSSDSMVVSVKQPLNTGGGSGGTTASNLISVEAEDFDTRVDTPTHQWVSSSLGGASNSNAMVTTPDNGTLKGGASGSPMMSYLVYFDQPGIHYVWVRGWGDTNSNGEGKNDSLHIGLNGKLSSTADKLDKFPSGVWHWSRSTRDGAIATLNVPSAGMHAINIWMREDGLAVDKFVISRDPDFIPQGNGPEVSRGASGADRIASKITGASIKTNTEWKLHLTSDGSTIDARRDAGTVEVDGKIYIMGGYGDRPVQSFDPVTNRWSNHGYPPVNFHHVQSVAIGRVIYVVSGFSDSYMSGTSLAHVYKFDTTSNTWTQAGAIPADRRRGAAGATAYNGKIYIVGGKANVHTGQSVAWFDEYDPANNAWRALADAPNPRDHMTIAVANKMAVVAGGRQSVYPNHMGLTVAATDIYNFVSGEWESTDANIPTQRTGAMTVAYGSEIIVIGGESEATTLAHSEVEAFNVNTGVWRQLKGLNVGRHSGVAAVVDAQLHVISGVTSGPAGNATTTHETLNLE